MVSDALHQKGANGLVAEYQCALRLAEMLVTANLRTNADLSALRSDRDNAVHRVANELTDQQVARAKAQGDALAGHIFKAISEEPGWLGITDKTPSELKAATIAIRTVGHNTNSGNSADLVLSFEFTDRSAVRIPISLKAYGDRASSLGSKSFKTSLSRVFLNKKRCSDADFIRAFGPKAQEFVNLLNDFEQASREFYSSPAGQQFIADYRARKNNSSARVNNPLRRKEVGDYFVETRGFVPEHKFAELYVQLFQIGMQELVGASDTQWSEFLAGLRFVLGMDNDILTLNAVADDRTGEVLRVENSFLSGTYGQIRETLVRGVDVQLTHRPGSSTIGVELVHGPARVRALSLAIWKDATIQFKLDTRSDDPVRVRYEVD